MGLGHVADAGEGHGGGVGQPQKWNSTGLGKPWEAAVWRIGGSPEERE